MSRVRRVLACDPDGTAVVEGAGGGRERVSLLALDGPPPCPGEWLIVHSGYAVGRLDEDTARAVLADLAVVRGAAPEGDA
ncbi:MAG TPA: HypC/HybG/HupF family hydrogenase formation chaperone [Acidimicrobiales bacterium]|nr:HypC/HybG/HupF family hydrogenase formation chaperone [Acidimicrobiales bacterium]